MEVIDFKSKFLAWTQALRLKFLLAAPIPQVLIGASMAWYFTHAFDVFLLLLAVLGVILAYLGCFEVNEYFDFRSKADLFVSKNDLTPFSGGSRALLTGLVKPESVYKMGVILLSLGVIVGAYLAFLVGIVILYFILAAVIGGYCYTAPPLKLAYRGIGEFWTGLYSGPLVILGAYYVLTKELALEPIIGAIPIGILAAAILWVNEIPDYYADKQAGKRTMIVIFGRKRAACIYPALLATIFTLLIFNVVIKVAPPISLLVLSTLPLAVRNSVTVKRYYNNSQKLIPALAGHIKLHLMINLILLTTYSVSPLIRL